MLMLLNDKILFILLKALLERLWQPILWRNLKVANSHVRCNATRFFLSAFPIENPNEELEIRGEKRVIKSFFT
jgi:hypothetical protein